jgi:hypothetical protein
MEMTLLSCQHCGVVIDVDVPTLEREYAYNHDGDRRCDAYRCPVCKELIESEIWEDVP